MQISLFYSYTNGSGFKVDKVTGKGLSHRRLFDGRESEIKCNLRYNTGDQDLSSFATNTNLLQKVDKVTGKGLSSEDYSAEKAKLGSISGSIPEIRI
jgi:hypothetical protein